MSGTGQRRTEQRAVAVVLMRDAEGRVLLQRRRDRVILAADGKWEFPGGRVDFGETPEQAAVRECREEVGCEVSVIRMLPQVQSRTWERNDGLTVHALVFCFECRLDAGTPSPREDKVSETRWCTLEDAIALDTLEGVTDFLRLAA